MIEYDRCLSYLLPGAQYGINHPADWSSLQWLDVRPCPTQAACDAIWPTILANDAAAAQAEATASTNGRTLEDQAVAALAANKAFYQRTSSTTAQVLAQVKALSRQNNGLIRLLLKRLDGVD